VFIDIFEENWRFSLNAVAIKPWETTAFYTLVRVKKIATAALLDSRKGNRCSSATAIAN